MPPHQFHRVLRRLFILFQLGLLSGCYYVQAAQGQWAISRAAEPVPAVIDDPTTPEALQERLALTQEALTFAHTELGLPDNGSYRRYVDLQRDFVVMNVFATPAMSLSPKTWCYPFVGCVAYRGYFKAEAAEQYAAKLSNAGYDVFLGEVSAYSTLGNLKDPLLSTMFRRSDDSLIWLLFHEMAHQIIYVDNDTAFNESFASAVADEGLKRWRVSRGETPPPVTPERSAQRTAKREAIELLKGQLTELYERSQDEQLVLPAKQALFAALADQWQEAGWSGRPPDNNAALVPAQLYADLRPAFARFLEAQCANDLECFYQRVIEMGAMDREARLAALKAAPSD